MKRKPIAIAAALTLLAGGATVTAQTVIRESKESCYIMTAQDVLGVSTNDWAIAASQTGAPSGAELAAQQFPAATTSTSLRAKNRICWGEGQPVTVPPTTQPPTTSTTSTTSTTVPPTTSTTTTTTVVPTTSTTVAPTTSTTTTTAPTTTMAPMPNMVHVDRSKVPPPQTDAQFTGVRLLTGRSTGTPGSDVGAMRTDCRFSHMAFDDPIVYPGQSGVSHLHAFYGNSGAYANMTTTMNGAPSTCSGAQGNNSAYWVPAMIDTRDGTPIVSDYNQIYYKSGYDGVLPSTVRPFPAGLRMVVGNARASSPQDNNIVWWYCNSNGTKSSSIPNCAPGDTLVQTIEFPQCWDGVNLDSTDHISHMSYGAGWPDRGCPSSHPVPLTQITQHVWYTVPAGGVSTWRLSSDNYAGPAGYSSHADWWNGWNQDLMTGWVNRCIVTSKDCHMNLMGDGTELRYPTP